MIAFAVACPPSVAIHPSIPAQFGADRRVRRDQGEAPADRERVRGILDPADEEPRRGVFRDDAVDRIVEADHRSGLEQPRVHGEGHRVAIAFELAAEGVGPLSHLLAG